MLKKFTPEQRARVKARAQELIEEKLTLRGLRQAQHLTQERMAELLGGGTGKCIPEGIYL